MTPDNRFAGYLAEAVGEDKAAKVLAALRLPPSVAVRFNPSKCGVTSPDAAASVFGIEAVPVPWSRYGFLLGGRPAFTLDPLLHAGAYYVQDSSAMFPGHIFRCVLQRLLPVNPERKSPLKVLDLCAAPGGKTTDLAASLREECGDGFLLVSNEVMKQRAAVLADNVSTWGDPSVAVTSADPADFKALPGFFDIIVADVPCSGEGMFRKDDDAAQQWSPENVSLCAARQKRILADIWPALAPGGVLVYSTCTFNRYENDLNIAWAIDTLGAEPMDFGTDFPGVLHTEYGSVLVPGLVKGEGQYCAALRKRGAGPEADSRDEGFKPRRGRPSGPDAAAKAAEAFRGYFDRPVEFAVKGDLVIALPAGIAPLIRDLKPLHPLRCGCAAGQIKGHDIIPDADLALSLMLEHKAFPSVELSREQALAFLHRDTLTLPQAEKGFVLLTYGGCALGFVKNLGNRCNSLLPPHRRIRMDIIQKQ